MLIAAPTDQSSRRRWSPSTDAMISLVSWSKARTNVALGSAAAVSDRPLLAVAPLARRKAFHHVPTPQVHLSGEQYESQFPVAQTGGGHHQQASRQGLASWLVTNPREIGRPAQLVVDGERI